MTRVTIRHGATLKCQGKVPSSDPKSEPTRCPITFTSYSVVSMIRKQAAIVGWGRVPAWHITADRGDGRQLGDACPEHHEIAKINAKNAGVLIRTQDAAELAQRRAARDAARAERDRIKAERAAAWAAKKEEWERRRVQKAERTQQRSEALAQKSAAAALKADNAATKVKQKAENTVRKKRARAAATKPKKTTPPNKQSLQPKQDTDRDVRIAGSRALVDGTTTENA